MLELYWSLTPGYRSALKAFAIGALIAIALLTIAVPSAKAATTATSANVRLNSTMSVEYYGAQIPIVEKKTTRSRALTLPGLELPAPPTVIWQLHFAPTLEVQVQGGMEFKTVSGKIEVYENEVFLGTFEAGETQPIENPRKIWLTSDEGNRYSFKRLLVLPMGGEYSFKLRFEVAPGVYYVSTAGFYIIPQTALVGACPNSAGYDMSVKITSHGYALPPALDVYIQDYANMDQVLLGKAQMVWFENGMAIYNFAIGLEGMAILQDSLARNGYTVFVFRQDGLPDMPLLLTPEQISSGCGKG